MKINYTEIKTLNPIKTIAISHLGDYSGIGVAFEKIAGWAAANNLWAATPKMAGVYHDDPLTTPVEQLRSEACLEDLADTAPGEGMKQYTISGGKYFVMQAEIVMAEFCEAWQKAYATVNEKAYQCDTRDHYELYVGCVGDEHDPDAPWIVEIRIPLK